MTHQKLNPRILIIRLSSVGDVLFCTPVAEALRELYPEGHLAWLVEEKSKDVVEGNQFLNEVIVWPRRRWRKERAQIGLLRFLGQHLRFLWRLRRRRFDLALDLQGMARSALVAWVSGAARRVGFQDAREMAQILYNNWVKTLPSSAYIPHRFVSAASFLGAKVANAHVSIPISEQDHCTAQCLLASALASAPPALSTQHSALPFVAFCPSASRPHKLWPAQRYALVADWVSENLGMVPLFLGAKDDITYVESIRGGCQRLTLSLAGQTSLKEAAALLATSQLVVGTDTALTHIGVALGKPVVALFGPAGVNYQPRGPLNEVLRADCDCAPCWSREGCDANYKCMRDIQAEQVISAIRRLVPVTQ